MNTTTSLNPDFTKNPDGLIPAIIQDAGTGAVLMLGYMNDAALRETEQNGRVTFWSRSKKRLWTKGEESGNFLHVVSIQLDCDNDTLLIKVNPAGAVCHTGAATCWGNENKGRFVFELGKIIQSRKDSGNETSYTSKLFSEGINKIAQKVGEEAVELVIESKDNDEHKFLGEAADLLYHYMVLLAAKGYSLGDVERVLEQRQK